MEVVSIERSSYEELLTSFNSFVLQMKAMAGRGTDKDEDVANESKPNSFTNPPQFAYPCIIAAPYQGALNPRLAFISGRIALIFQNRFLFTSFFRNFATLN